MLDKQMKIAMLLGTFSLVWTVPSMNLIALLAFGLSWLGYIRPTRKAALAAGIAYIIATLISLITFAFILSGGSFFMSMAGAVIDTQGEMTVAPLLKLLVVLSVIGELLYVAAAIVSLRRSRTLPKDGQGKGFFD